MCAQGGSLFLSVSVSLLLPVVSRSSSLSKHNVTFVSASLPCFIACRLVPSCGHNLIVIVISESVLVLHACRSGSCYGQRKKLQKHGLPLTERELTMLAYGVDQLVQMGRDPDEELLVVQVDTCFRLTNYL